MNRIFGYVRVSTEDQADSGLGLEACRETIHTEYDKVWSHRGFEFAGIYEDPAISGGKPLRARKGGSRLIGAVGRGDVIIFPKLDRGFRDTEETLREVRVLGERGVKCAFLDLPFDTNTPEGELFLTQVASFARFERRKIGERTKAGLAVKKREAHAKGKLSPLGNPRFGLKRVKGRYIVNLEEYKEGLRILDWKRKGYRDVDIAHHLNAKRVLTSIKRLRWTDSSVRRARISMQYILIWLEEKDKDGHPKVTMPKH